jgi:hypothetical protein
MLYGWQTGLRRGFAFKIPGENLVIFGSKDGGYMINLNLGNTSQLRICMVAAPHSGCPTDLTWQF